MQETFGEWLERLSKVLQDRGLVSDAHPNDLRWLYLNWYTPELAILEIDTYQSEVKQC